MALITRMARLFRADMHAVLDRIEEPEALLRQALREMEEALDRDRRRLGAMRREQGLLDSRIGGLERSLEALEGELDLCFSAGKETLARATVKRKLEAERLHQLLDGRRRTLAGEMAALGARVEENQARLEAMRQKAELLAEERVRETPDEVWSGAPEPGLREEEVEVAFLREQQKRRQPR